MGPRIIRRALIRPKLSPLAALLPALFGAACSTTSHEPGDAGISFAALECEGACPLYVDPGAAAEGDGSSWDSPLSSVQAAIDAKGAEGGGEVWVRAGGPFAALSGAPDVTLLNLRSGVAVLGGFAGTEASPEDREPAARTLIAGAADGAASENAPLITAATNAMLDGFAIVGQHGPALTIRNATGVRISNLSITDGYVNQAGIIDVADSDVQLDGVSVNDSTTTRGVPGVRAERSTVRVTGGEFARLRAEMGGSTGILASSSKVVLEGVSFIDNATREAGQSAGLHATGSDVLVIDSVWLRNKGDRGSLWAVGSNLVAVNAHFEGNLHAAATVQLQQSTTATFLNSSFVANSSSVGGVVTNRDSDLEIVSTTFADNTDTYPSPNSNPDDVKHSGTGQVALHNSYSNRGAQSIFAPYAGSGNCLVDGADPHREPTPVGITKVLLRADGGCTNTGSDGATSSATAGAASFAETLGVSIPLAGDWWQTSSSVLDVPADSGPLDPGRHYAPTE